MKAIILAAGEGTRLRPITLITPKPLIKILDKPILEYNLEIIYKYVDEIIIVVKYMSEKIEEYFWDNYKWIPITYHLQWEEKGTGGALKWLEYIKWDVFLLYGDSILDRSDIEEVIKSDYYGCLVKEVEDPSKYWVYKQDENWFATEMIEKPQSFIWNLANLWGYKFSDDIFKYLSEIKTSIRWEYEITEVLNKFIKLNKFKLIKIKWNFIDVGYPEDIEKAEKQILKKPKIWKIKILESINGFDLFLWITDKNIEELINYSLDKKDTELLDNTSDEKRFSSIQKVKNWYNDDNRYVFTLVNKKWELAWIWWWRPSNLPAIKKIFSQEIYNEIIANKENFHTSGIRIYPNFRGKWLAKNLLKSENYYSYIFPDCYMSIDIESDNIPSQKSYERKWYRFFAIWQNDNSSKQLSWEKERMIYIRRFMK